MAINTRNPFNILNIPKQRYLFFVSFLSVQTLFTNLVDGLIVHRSITLFDLQLDAQILIYLHIIHLIKSSTCFEHYPAYLQEVYVVIVYMQPLVSSLSAGNCLVHRLRKNS